MHFGFGILCFTVNHGSGKVVLNLDSHSLLQYVLCLYPNHVMGTFMSIINRNHQLYKLQHTNWESNYNTEPLDIPLLAVLLATKHSLVTFLLYLLGNYDHVTMLVITTGTLVR